MQVKLKKMLSVRTLSPELQKKAESELNEREDKIIQNVEQIQDWLNEHLDLLTPRDDQWILNYLRGCKHNVELTREKITMYSDMRSKAKYLFANRDPLNEDIQFVLKKGISVPMPKTLGKAEPTVVIVRPGLADPKSVSLATVLKVSFMFIEILIKDDDNSTIAGQHIIIDLKNLSYKYITQMTPSLIKHVIHCVQYAYPVRVKGFYFLNSPFLFKAALNLITKILVPKLANRVYVNSEEINDILQAYNTILPVEYGGQEKSIDILAGQWKNKIEKSRSWFMAFNQ